MSDLITLDQKTIPEVFVDNGLEPYIDQVREAVRKKTFSTDTEKDRKEIRSFARKVSSSKTYLDDLGKALVGGIKQQAKVIDDERKRMRESLDSLRDWVKEPLTKWEKEEGKRIDRIHARITEMKTLANQACAKSANQLNKFIEEFTQMEMDESFEEFRGYAIDTFVETTKMLHAKLAEKRLHDKAMAALKEKEAKEKSDLGRVVHKQVTPKSMEMDQIHDAIIAQLIDLGCDDDLAELILTSISSGVLEYLWIVYPGEG